MTINKILCYAAVCVGTLSTPYTLIAEEDIFADYNKSVQKPADAKVTNVYEAWGENMANMINSGYRDGVVVDGPGEYGNGKIRADGVGNVLIDKNANVGPVINQTDVKNSTIVIQQNKKRW